MKYAARFVVAGLFVVLSFVLFANGCSDPDAGLTVLKRGMGADPEDQP